MWKVKDVKEHHREPSNYYFPSLCFLLHFTTRFLSPSPLPGLCQYFINSSFPSALLITPSCPGCTAVPGWVLTQGLGLLVGCSTIKLLYNEKRLKRKLQAQLCLFSLERGSRREVSHCSGKHRPHTFQPDCYWTTQGMQAWSICHFQQTLQKRCEFLSH